MEGRIEGGGCPTHELRSGDRRGLGARPTGRILPGASSIDDKTIPTFSRGELPHFAGINTFLKAPYIEDSRLVGNYDVAVVGVPFDGGCTYRAGTVFKRAYLKSKSNPDWS